VRVRAVAEDVEPCATARPEPVAELVEVGFQVRGADAREDVELPALESCGAARPRSATPASRSPRPRTACGRATTMPPRERSADSATPPAGAARKAPAGRRPAPDTSP